MTGPLARRYVVYEATVHPRRYVRFYGDCPGCHVEMTDKPDEALTWTSEYGAMEALIVAAVVAGTGGAPFSRKFRVGRLETEYTTVLHNMQGARIDS